MRVSQYTYFALSSLTVTASDMAARIDMEPDEVMIRGSRRNDPPLPVAHRWKIVCGERHMTVDDQVRRLITRLAPVTRAVGDSRSFWKEPMAPPAAPAFTSSAILMILPDTQRI